MPVRIAPRIRRPYVRVRPARDCIVGQITFPSTELDTTIELALGADLTADPSTWVWTDVTAYVYERDSIIITAGRANEAGVVDASSLAMTVKNGDGRWCRTNPEGPWYGQLGLNTPIRVTVNPGTGPIVRAEQYISQLPKRWDKSGSDQNVPIRAAGVLRRMGQGTSPAYSSVTRHTLTAGPVAFWPCEDPSGSTSAVSVLPGAEAMRGTGAITYGADSDLDGCGGLPTFALGGTLWGTVPDYTDTGGWTVTAIVKVPTAGADVVTMLDVITSSGLRWTVDLDPSTTPDRVYVRAYSTAGVVLSSGFMEFTDPVGNLGDLYGTHVSITVSAAQDGTATKWYAAMQWRDGTSTNGWTITSTTIASTTLGTADRVRLAPYGNFVGTAGQVAVQSTWSSNTGVAGGGTVVEPSLWMDGLNGQAAAIRIDELGDFADIPMTFVRPDARQPGFFAQYGAAMGVQSPTSLVSGFRDCEAVDAGVLSEYRFGLRYELRASRYNVQPTMALDYDQGHLVAVEPDDDDQQIRNDWTISRTGGALARYSDEEHVAATQRYDDAATLNVYEDATLLDRASWRVHLGTVREQRISRIGINFVAAPELITAWAQCRIGSRITVANHPNVSMGPDLVDLTLEGYTETIGPFAWGVSITPSLYRPNEVFQIEHPRLGRIDTSGSKLTAGIDTTDTTWSVTTTATVPWLTTATRPADFPLDIEIGGEQITVTAITGATSPQDFTVTRSVNGVVKSHAADAAVKLWKPGAIAL